MLYNEKLYVCKQPKLCSKAKINFMLTLNKSLHTLFIFLFFTSLLVAQDPFITTWKTDNPGTSGNNQITIPTLGTGYLYDIDWENDGVYDDFGVTGNITHTYASSGTYQIAIRGDFPRIKFPSSSVNEKILSVDQWGEIAWQSMEFAFMSCNNLVVLASDTPDLSSVTSLEGMFWQANGFTGDLSDWDVSNIISFKTLFFGCASFSSDLKDWDVSSGEDFEAMFGNCSSFNSDLSLWDVSSAITFSNMFANCIQFESDLSAWDVNLVIDMSSTFAGCLLFDSDLGNWNVSAVLDFSGFLNGTATSTLNYDKLLIGWNNLPSLNSNLIIGANNFSYCFGNSARNNLITTYNWDFGFNYLDCSNSMPPFDKCYKYFSANTLGEIHSYNSAFEIEELVFNSDRGVVSLSVDRDNQLVYFLTVKKDQINNSYEFRIESINFTGDNHSIIIDGLDTYPNYTGNFIIQGGSELLVNDLDNKIYFHLPDNTMLDENLEGIFKCDLDGSNLEIVLSVPNMDGSLGLDKQNQKILFYKNGLARCNLDGTNQEQLISGLITDFTLDEEVSKIYAFDGINGNLLQCNLDGSSLIILQSGIQGIIISSHINYNNQSLICFASNGVFEYDLLGSSTQLSGEILTVLSSVQANTFHKIPGCDECGSYNYNQSANFNDGSCESCSDGILNGDETNIDCGGAYCMPCCVQADYILPQTEYDALFDFYYSTDGPNWQNTVDGINPWFEDCDPCGLVDGTPWFGLTCNINNKLAQIYMPNNNMEGTMPTTLNVFSELTWFNVNGDYDNNTPDLSGPIPDVSLLNLIHFGIGRNQVSGSVPADFTNMTLLATFYVPSNNLTGPLPILGPAQPNLHDIRFDNNYFSGEIPFQYGNISQLNAFTVNNNELTGCYDQALRGICGNTIITVSNDKVSYGNNFNEPWEDFCNYSYGGCCNDVVTLSIDSLAPGDYYANELIIANGNLRSEDSIYLHAPRVEIIQGSNNLLLNSYLEVDTDGCIDKTSLNFDGINNFVNLPAYSAQGDLTISMWFRMDQSNNSQFDNRLLSISEPGSQQFEIGVAVNSNNVWMYEKNNSTNTFGPTLDDGKWHQVVVVRDSDNLKIFIDGTLENSFTGVDTDWGDEIFLGRCACGGLGHYWDGDIDEFYMFSNAKSDEYVTDTLFCSEYDVSSDATIYYDFNNHVPYGDNTSTLEIVDKTSNGYDSSLNGFALTGQESNFVNDSNPAVCCTQAPSFSCSTLSVNLTLQDLDNDGNPDEGGYASVLASDFIDIESHPCELNTTYSFSIDLSDTIQNYHCNNYGSNIPIIIYGTDINGNSSTCNTILTVTDNTPLCDGQ